MSQAQPNQQFMNGGFNTAEHEVFGGLTGLIAGVAEVAISASEIKAITNGNGGKLELVIDGVSGENMGRKTIHNLSIYHKDPETAKRANRELSTICAAIGLTGVLQSSAQLHGHRFFVLVEPRKDEEGMKKGWTQITKILLDGADGAAVAGQPAQTTQQTQANNGGGWNTGNGGGQQTQQTQQQQPQQQTQQQQNPQQTQSWGGPVNGNNGGAQPTWGQ